MIGNHPRLTIHIDQPEEDPYIFRGAEREEIPASGVSVVQPIRRRSRGESPERSHNPDMENRPSERREGGEGRELVSAGAVDTGPVIDVS